MNQLIFLPAITPLLIILYLFPGFVLSRSFRGSIRNNPLFWIFLSLLFNGILYSFLALTGSVSLAVWLFMEFLVLVPFYLVVKKGNWSLSLEPPAEKFGLKSLRVLFLLSLLVVFFLLVAYTKFGIFIKRTPLVADDYAQIPRVVSIAATPSKPKHFYYPLSNLSYYYYGQVSAGLLTRFSGNYVKANRSFAINFVVQTAASLYLLWLASFYLFRNFTGRLFSLLPLTFFGGFEFPVSFLAGQRDLFNSHLEYWPGFPLIRNMPQISNFTTMSIWAPHHLFSALLLLFLFLLLFKVEGRRPLKSFFLALVVAGALGFSFFSGLVLLATYLVFVLRDNLEGRFRFASLVEVGLTLLGAAFFVAPFLSIIGGRGTEFSLSASRMHLIPGVGGVNALADFLVSLPVYFFLELGLLFLGLLLALKTLLLGKFHEKETVFWLIPLVPLIFVLFFKFPEATDFVIRSRSITPSLLALAVFTGWVGERLKRSWSVIFLLLFLATTLSPLSEFVQNFKTTPRAYTFFSNLDRDLPLNALLFTEQRAAPYFWPAPIFIHRLSVKPNQFWDQVDLQYTGLSAPPPEGLTGDDYGSVRKFIQQHPVLLKDYQVYYLSLQKLELPVKYQDLDYRLYIL